MSRSADVARDLFEAARDAMARCHAPYSKFPVGAAIRADDGRIYAGANIEVISFPEGWCAETTAIGHMIMAGATRIREVAVIAEKLELMPALRRLPATAGGIRRCRHAGAPLRCGA
jgi:cytidine deaminase